MFFNSANLLYGEVALVDDIKKAIYLPIHHLSRPFVKPLPLVPKKKKKDEVTKTTVSFHRALRNRASINMIKGPSFGTIAIPRAGQVNIPMRSNFYYI
ncbi:Hypothetical predicted protein [Olea europaea subsp. europaea]|uniref:Uncharacterized protein n=1 Tax=Olea europaea subsp. europaea TaxID=158383 RepID=A0A8S0SAE4_OLEEU|nr:Hypothetical predicted protein [Olea europaea subsp. europaea]